MVTTEPQVLHTEIFIGEGSTNQVWKDEEVREVISDFIRRQTVYARRNTAMLTREDFFEGRHWDPLDEDDDQEAYRLVLNYCRRIVLGRVAGLVKAPTPRINTTAGRLETTAEKAQRRERLLFSIWPDLMKAWRGVEMNSTKLGFGVLQILWIDPSDNKVTPEGIDSSEKKDKAHFKFRSISPYKFFPVYRSYDDNNDFMGVYRYDPGRLVSDLKERFGVDLQEASSSSLGQQVGYEYDVIGVDPAADLIEYWTDKRYILIARTNITVVPRSSLHSRNQSVEQIEGYTVLSSGKNPFGIIPFWVVPNIRTDPNRDPTHKGTMSDIDDIAFLNQHYDHILSEEAEEIAISIHRPVVYKSEEHQQNPSDLIYGPGQIWPIGQDEDADVLPAADEVSAVDRHLGRLLKGMQDVSFYGDAGFGRTERNVSGVAADIALSPSKQYLELKIPHRKDVLESACSFVLRVFEKFGGNSSFKKWFRTKDGRYNTLLITPEDIDGQYYVEVVYGNLIPRDDHAFDQNEVYRLKTDAQSLWTTLDRMGHADPLHEIQRMKEEMNDPELHPDRVILIEQAKAIQQQAKGGGQQQGAPAPQAGQGGPQGQQQGRPLPGQEQQGAVGGGAGAGQLNTAPPVPGSPEFPPQGVGGQGPGQLAPFLQRGTNPNFNPNQAGAPGSQGIPNPQQAPGRASSETLRKRQ